MFGEFNLIDKYFSNRQAQRKDVHLAMRDGCAIVKVPGNSRVVISTDTLVAGTHFLVEANPAWVAHKALASNISDLAAMGATPARVSLALTLPEIYDTWLTPFCDAFRVGQLLQCSAHWWRYRQISTQYHINRTGFYPKSRLCCVAARKLAIGSMSRVI